MFLNMFEILDIIIMTLVMGFLFMSTLKPIKKTEDVLDKYLKGSSRMFDWHALWFAALVTAPAIILHEFGHKIVALSFGLTSTFHSACSTSNLLPGSPPFFDFYCGLMIISIILKIINFGFIFFIPALVQTSGSATVLQHVLIAAAGPFVNLLLFLTAWLILKYHKSLAPKTAHFLTLTKNINIFLLIFNIIPIPGFDGFNIFSGLGHLAGFW
jgi:Zn-dependent protease